MKKILCITLNLFLLCCILAGAFVLRALYLKNTIGLTALELNVYLDSFNPKDIDEWKNILHGSPIFSLYNILLSSFNTFISDNTTYLRGLSVIFGVITCFFSYFLEKRFQGFLCLILFSLNSFLINYSQEIGMYSLLGMFATLNVVSLIKIKTDDKAFFLWLLSVTGMILTSLPTILFVITEIIIFGLYQRKNKFFVYSGLALLLNLPYFAYVIFNFKKYLGLFLGIDYDYANIFTILQNFLAPNLIELNIENYIYYYQTLFLEINFYSLGFILFPVVISLYFIVKALINNKFNIILFLIGIIYIILRTLLQLFFGIPFYIGEHIVILPIFLIIMTYGFEKNIISVSLLISLLGINSAFLITQENSAMKNKRVSILTFSEIINKTVKDGDAILTWIKVKDLGKSINNKKVIFDNITDVYIERSSFFAEDKKAYEKMNPREKKEFLRKNFLIQKLPQSTLFGTSILLSKLEKDNKIYLVYPKIYDYEYRNFMDIVSKDYLYAQYKEKDLMFLHTITQLKILLANKFVDREEKNNIVVNIYKK